MRIRSSSAQLFHATPNRAGGIALVAALVGVLAWQGWRMAQAGAGLNGIIFLIVGVFLGVIFGGAVMRGRALRLDRTAGTAQIGSQVVPLTAVSGAVIQTRSGRGTATATGHRVALVINGAPVPLTAVYRNGPGAADLAGAINRWLTG
jgi:hypothetical protein